MTDGNGPGVTRVSPGSVSCVVPSCRASSSPAMVVLPYDFVSGLLRLLRPRDCFQLGKQFLEVVALAQHIEIPVLRQVCSVLVARLDGLVKQLHGAVGVLLLLAGRLATGHGIDAG